MTEPRFSSASLWVSDLGRSLAFYRDVVGVPLGESHGHEPENVPHAEAMTGDLEGLFFFFVLHQAEPGAHTVRGHVGFNVGDLEGAHARLSAAGVPVLDAPADVAWGREAKYLDPDGNFVSLTGN